MDTTSRACVLDEKTITRAVRETCAAAKVQVLSECESTNAVAAEAVLDGRLGHGDVVVTSNQTRGRGRLGRTWESSPGAGLACSIVVDVTLVRPALVPWCTLAMGVAITSVLRDRGGVDAAVKWPNDVLIGGAGKVSGVLAELVPAGERTFAVVGWGLNVAQRADELPDGAMSLRTCGASCTDPNQILAWCYAEYLALIEPWIVAEGDAAATGLFATTVSLCDTIGRQIRVTEPQDRSRIAMAVGLDETGQLLIQEPGEVALQPLAAGDVVHVRDFSPNV